MNLFFVTISLVFILFLAISYFIGIIRLSSPLILIYLIFCFSYLINQDIKEEAVEVFINRLDPNKNIFTSREVDQFSMQSKKESNIKEDVSNAFNLFNKYVQRYHTRYETQINFLKTNHNVPIINNKTPIPKTIISLFINDIISSAIIGMPPR